MEIRTIVVEQPSQLVYPQDCVPNTEDVSEFPLRKKVMPGNWKRIETKYRRMSLEVQIKTKIYHLSSTKLAKV